MPRPMTSPREPGAAGARLHPALAKSRNRAILHHMTLRVLLFASYADAFGRDALDVALPAGATVGDLVAALTALRGGERLPPRPLVAVNQGYADYGRSLTAGDEVAVIPPVAGG